MKCLHCGQTVTKSATEMRYQLAGLCGHDIKVCRQVPDVYKPQYKHLLKAFLDRQAVLTRQKRLEQEHLKENNHKVASGKPMVSLYKNSSRLLLGRFSPKFHQNDRLFKQNWNV